MNKLIVKICVCIILISGTLISVPFGTERVINAENQIPPYAKWGKMAMEKTKEKYPDTSIIDYLHVGRDEGFKTSTEKFKLWLKRKDNEFGVFVEIEFENTTEKFIRITFKEVSK
jgi:hypothetical protein